MILHHDQRARGGAMATLAPVHFPEGRYGGESNQLSMKLVRAPGLSSRTSLSLRLNARPDSPSSRRVDSGSREKRSRKASSLASRQIRISTFFWLMPAQHAIDTPSRSVRRAMTPDTRLIAFTAGANMNGISKTPRLILLMLLASRGPCRRNGRECPTSLPLTCSRSRVHVRAARGGPDRDRRVRRRGTQDR